jgi:hypothetical protein
MKPTNIEECMGAMKDILSTEDQVEIVRMKKDELIRLHHNLGRWIRNNWGLWEEGPLYVHMKALGFLHPDDMSQALIHEYWNRSNNQSSTLQEEIEEYKQYWEAKRIEDPMKVEE